MQKSNNSKRMRVRGVAKTTGELRDGQDRSENTVRIRHTENQKADRVPKSRNRTWHSQQGR